MNEWKLKSPVAFLIFNRPDLTERVFDCISAAKPQKLFVVADGPRDDHPDDSEMVMATRAIIDRVDWDCEVVKDYSQTNLGCAKRVASGLDGVFGQTESAIILEDDCVPHPTFFRYCDELLSRYHNDESVMAISGDNFQFGKKRTDYSYYFSRYNHCWGWATWARAWKHFDLKLKQWPNARDTGQLKDILNNRRAVKYWSDIFQRVHNGEIDTWDYSWTFSCWLNNGLTVLPEVNLVSNIGFGGGATHTGEEKNKFAEIPAMKMEFSMKHPPSVSRNISADKFTERNQFSRTFCSLALAKIGRMLSKS